MPISPPRPCSRHPRVLLPHGMKCPECKEAKQVQDRQRGTASNRGYGARWQKARKQYLKAHPLCECEDCKENKLIKVATVVDHIIPHKGNMTLFWDRTNWQTMTKTCHDRKTAKYDGAWGKKIID